MSKGVSQGVGCHLRLHTTRLHLTFKKLEGLCHPEPLTPHHLLEKAKMLLQYVAGDKTSLWSFNPPLKRSRSDAFLTAKYHDLPIV